MSFHDRRALRPKMDDLPVPQKSVKRDTQKEIAQARRRFTRYRPRSRDRESARGSRYRDTGVISVFSGIRGTPRAANRR